MEGLGKQSMLRRQAFIKQGETMSQHLERQQLRKDGQRIPESALKKVIAQMNELINSPARSQSEWVLRQIIQERASVNQASSNFQK
jgi:hypothetical protein